MKGIKRLTALVLSLVMVFSVNTTGLFTESAKAEDVPFAITEPVENSLKAAGFIDVKWNAATTGEVKDYSVYVDEELVKTTTALTCEFYTTLVCYHEAYVVANFKDGSKQTTDKVKFGVSKKGLCVARDMGQNLDPATVGASWYYNWGTGPFNFATYKDLEFVPMIWGKNESYTIANWCKQFESKGYKYVLGFNEPELWMNQSKIPVNDALRYWSGFMNTTLRVGSPATALNPMWEQKKGDWWHDFMVGIEADPKLDFDFIAVHIYYDNYASAQAGRNMLKIVDDIWEKYHKPIWMTEYAPAKNVTKEGTADMVKVTTEGFTLRPYVERFSYFNFNPNGDGSKNAALWYYEDGRLTDAGKNYADYGNPTTDWKHVEKWGEPNKKPEETTPTVTVKKPAKANIKKVSKKKFAAAKAKIVLKKINGVKGYQVAIYKTKKLAKKNKKALVKKFVKKVKPTIKSKKLKNKKALFVKARAYVLDGKGKKVYGKWSKAKKIRIKK